MAGQATLSQRAFLRLLPERAVRESPFTAADSPAERDRGRVLVLTLVPPEDTGGGSRPAQLAAELRRRGFAIDWRYALPIYPWPRGKRPAVDGVTVTALQTERGAVRDTPPLVLVAAPHPQFETLLDSLPATVPIVYDAIDVWDGELGAGWYDRATEDRIVARAGVLVASSALLRNELEVRTGRPVALIENGVDTRRFAASASYLMPTDLRRGTPTVVYVGALWGEWVDLDFVADVARRLPDAAFNLIGPAGSRRLPAVENVFALGAKPQREVPAYLHAADVAIVPFATSRLSAAVSPLKAFEYLAMAKPVVATPLPELASAPGVTIAADADAFAAAIVRATSEPFPRDAAATFVARHTWQERVQRLLDVVAGAAADARTAGKD